MAYYNDVEFVCETCGEVFTAYGRFVLGYDGDTEFVPFQDDEVICPNETDPTDSHDVSL